MVTAADVRLCSLNVNPQKATGLNGVLSYALTYCVDQLAGVFAHIFNLSLLQSELTTFFKKITIIPVPKKTHAACLSDYCLVALTSIIMKYFKSKRKELGIDFRKWRGGHVPVCINGAEVEMVESIKFLGVKLTDNLSWSTH
eukprot:g36832.t1